MNGLLQTATTLLAQLKSLQPLQAKDQQRLDKKFRLEFSYNSNHLEGNTLTYSETQLLLIFGDATGNHTKRELDEMEAHDVAWQMVEEWASTTDHALSEKDIRSLNEIILVKPFWKEAQTPDGQSTRRLIRVGQYKEQPNSVRLQNGEIFHYASPADTPIQMGELIDWYRSEETQNLHPVAQAALLHYRFVRIHPFDDGNGRISRLLMNYVLRKHHYPPAIIKTEAKAAYLRALHRADTGNEDAFVDYIAEQVLWSLGISLKAARGESIDETGDFEKRVAQLKRKQRLPATVEQKYSEEAFLKVIMDLADIVNGWEAALLQVDSLLHKREAQAGINEAEILLSTSTLSALWQTYFQQGSGIQARFGKIYKSRQLYITVILQTQKHTAVQGGELRLLFHENFYELSVNQKLFKQFYYSSDRSIQPEDSDEIVRRLSNHLLTNLETQLAESSK